MEPRGVVDASGPAKCDIRDLGIMLSLLFRAMQPLPALHLDFILCSCRKIYVLFHGSRLLRPP